MPENTKKLKDPNCPKCKAYDQEIVGIKNGKTICFKCKCGHFWATNHIIATTYARAKGKMLW